MEGGAGAPFSVASFNVNGLAGFSSGRLGAVLETLGPLEVLAVQETKLSSTARKGREPVQEQMVREFGERGYECYFNTSSLRAGYSGVCCVARENTVVEAYDWFLDEEAEPCQQCEMLCKEGRVLILDLGSVVVINVYVPNGGKEVKAGRMDVPQKKEFLRRLRATCDLLQVCCSPPFPPTGRDS